MMQPTRSSSVRLLPWNACGRRVGGAVQAALLGALLLAPAGAAAHDFSGTDEPAIPPGQEELIGAMIGKGASLPDDCKLVSGVADHTSVKATYSCSGSEVVFELAHPSTASATATRTEQFAVDLKSGSSPSGLSDALVSLVRSQETAFEWMMPPQEDDDAADDDGGDED